VSTDTLDDDAEADAASLDKDGTASNEAVDLTMFARLLWLLALFSASRVFGALRLLSEPPRDVPAIKHLDSTQSGRQLKRSCCHLFSLELWSEGGPQRLIAIVIFFVISFPDAARSD
jgi:hypothetical protein